MRLDRHAGVEPARDGLGELRLAGVTKQLTLATKKFAADGPARAVALALATVDFDVSTRTTASADLALHKPVGQRRLDPPDRHEPRRAP